MNRSTGEFERHLYDSLHPEKLSRPPLKHDISYVVDHITFIIEDFKNRIWIGTLQGGINIYDPATQKISYYGANNGAVEKLTDDKCWTAYTTRDHITWVSTWGNNLYKVSPYQTSVPHVTTSTVVAPILEDESNSLWLGVRKGLMHIDKNGKEENFYAPVVSPSALTYQYY